MLLRTPRGFVLLRARLPGLFLNSFVFPGLPLTACPIPLLREALT